LTYAAYSSLLQGVDGSKQEVAMSNIDSLARDWITAKQEEDAARMRRIGIEGQLTAALDAKEEGSITHKLEGYKVTLTQPVSRKLIESEWEKVRGECPMEFWPVKTKIEADATGLKWLAANEPKYMRKIANAFESKKGKIGVKVEAIDNGN
jgi:hypothetical protein